MEVQQGQSMSSEREDPQTAEAIEQGIQYQNNGENDRAIECFTEAIRLNPECVRAYHLRGQIYSETGKWGKAERDVSKARRAEARQQATADH